MEPNIRSISSNSANVRQDVFPFEQWTITTRKGIILQSKCTCNHATTANDFEQQTCKLKNLNTTHGDETNLCSLCKHTHSLPHLHSMPDMLFNNNILRLKHYTGVGLEFNVMDALKLVKETKDPLQVAVAGGWQSARADFPFAKSIVKPFDWTFTTDYRGTLISAIKNEHANKQKKPSTVGARPGPATDEHAESNASSKSSSLSETALPSGEQPVKNDIEADDQSKFLLVEETDERIDVNKLKVKEEILFYDDVALYEDELADHGTAQYSVKVRVMPKLLFILARFYLRVDGVLARINDTRIYHELNRKYLLREYTNREARLSSLNLPVSTLINPNELMNHLPIVESKYERLSLPVVMRR